jgi:hypothetical protein
VSESDIYAVEISGFASKPNPTVFNMTLELDGQHDYLPRRIAYYAVENPSWTFAIEVDRFEQVQDSSTAEQRWFPMEGRKLQESPEDGKQEFKIVVNEVRINDQLPDSLFVPELPDGASVVDNTAAGRGKFYMAGGESASDEHLTGLAQDAVHQMGERTRLRTILACSLLALLVATGAIVWRLDKKAAARK